MVTDRTELRDEVGAWLAEHWDPEQSLQQWRSLLADSGWGCPTWPPGCWGRGLSPGDAAIVAEELKRVGAPGAATGVGMSLAAPTILEHGSPAVRARYLRRILTGEDKWCQLFSEPGSGSDLAGLTTRADRDGDEWIVNGQKVWNSGALQADYGILLARTDWDAPKHRGITYFVFPMRQQGVEVRPLRQMNFHASFNEVFLSDARVADADRVGEEGAGWAAALTTLAHERGVATSSRPRFPRDAAGRTVREAAEEAAAYYQTYRWYPQRAGRADLVVPRATESGRNADPLIRQQVAEVETRTRTARWNAERSRAARAAGKPPGPEGSLAKLAASEVSRSSARTHAAITGAHAMLSGPNSPEHGMIAEVLVSTPAVSIAGGTDEIQHNIIGERVLGLPREPATDTDRPFREVRRNL